MKKCRHTCCYLRAAAFEWADECELVPYSLFHMSRAAPETSIHAYNRSSSSGDSSGDSSEEEEQGNNGGGEEEGEDEEEEEDEEDESSEDSSESSGSEVIM